MKLKKVLSVGISAMLMILSTLTVSADGLFDEVYTHYYYKHVFSSNTTMQYCLSSDSSLETAQQSQVSSQNYVVNINDEMINENVSPAAIIGDNDLVEMNPYDQRIVQTKAYYHLEGDLYRVEYGTGFILPDQNGKSCIGTAAHNLYDSVENEYPDFIYIDVRSQTGNGVVYSCNAESVHIRKDFIDTGNNLDNDYALIVLNSNISLSETYGYYYLGVAGTSTGLGVNIAGYGKQNNEDIFRQWKSSGSVVGASEEHYFYNSDTIESMSGGPIYMTISGDDYIVGIHSGYGYSNELGSYNQGARIRWSNTRFLVYNPNV